MATALVPPALAKLSAEQFHAKNFAQCTETTKKILQHLKGKAVGTDIQHNYIIASYCSSNGQDPEKYLTALLKISSQWNTDIEKERLTEERCTILYNISLLEYSLKQYRTALSHLEPVFSSIENFSDFLSIRVCFLLLDIYLILGKQHCNVVQNATKVLSFLQSFSALLKKATANGGNEKKGNKKGNNKNSVNSDADSSRNENENTPAIDAKEFKYHFHLYKAKFNLFNNVFNQATREIKCCMSVSNQSAHPMFLKSNLENLKENFDKSVKILNAIQDDKTDPTLPALYFNNIGCIHFQLKKYEAAGYYFARAITENESIYDVTTADGSTRREVCLGTFIRDRRMEILYNTGLLHLLSGKPEIAFDCFQGSSLMYYKDPRLWLRLAECCVASHAKTIEEKRISSPRVSPLFVPPNVSSSGERTTTKIVLHTDPDVGIPISESEAETKKFIFSAPPFGNLSLEYAEKCLRSCLYICRKILSKFPEANESNSESLRLQVTKDDLDTIRQAALTNLAYVCLATNNPKIAITCANNLLLSKQGDHSYSLFAHFYAAEAYCMLDNPGDALKHLPMQEIPVDLECPYFQQPYSASVRYSLLHNVVVTHILMRDFAQAQFCLAKALAACPPQLLPTAILLQAYLELQADRPEIALQLLQKGRPSPATRVIAWEIFIQRKFLLAQQAADVSHSVEQHFKVNELLLKISQR